MGRSFCLLELIHKTTKTISDAVKKGDDVAAHLHAGNRKRMVDELTSLKRKVPSEDDGKIVEDWKDLLKKINDLDEEIIKEINRRKEQISSQIGQNFKMKSYMKKYNIMNTF